MLNRPTFLVHPYSPPRRGMMIRTMRRGKWTWAMPVFRRRARLDDIGTQVEIIAHLRRNAGPVLTRTRPIWGW